MADKKKKKDSDEDGKDEKKRRSSGKRPGDVTLDDSYFQRLLFRLGTDLANDLGTKSYSVPVVSHFVDMIVAALGETGASFATNAIAAAAQAPRVIRPILGVLGIPPSAVPYVAEVIDEVFDGVRDAIHHPDVDGKPMPHINEPNVLRALKNAREKAAHKLPVVPKTYSACFLALSLKEEKILDGIVRAFDDKQIEAFNALKPKLNTTAILRSGLAVTEGCKDQRPKELLAFFGRLSDPAAPKGAAEEATALASKISVKVGEYLNKAASGVEGGIDKLLQPLTTEERDAMKEKRLQREQELKDRVQRLKDRKW